MRIGIYGGTFDPIHLGHLNMAIQIREKLSLDEIWLVPTHINPLKKEGESANGFHRLHMLELAIENLPFFKISRIELDRPAPSYTVDTIRLLQEQFPKYDFSLIVGADSLSRFDEWKEPQEIVKKVPLIIGTRRGFEQPANYSNNPLIQKAIKDGIMELGAMDISGTEIRERVNRGLYIEHLVPSKVVDYIYDNHLYFKD